MQDDIKKEIKDIVKNSGSSFYWGMRMLHLEKREAISWVWTKKYSKYNKEISWFSND